MWREVRSKWKRYMWGGGSVKAITRRENPDETREASFNHTDYYQFVCVCFFYIASSLYIIAFTLQPFTFTSFGRRPYIVTSLIYTTEQFTVKGLPQGPHSNNLALLGFELTTFRSLSVYLCLLQHFTEVGPGTHILTFNTAVHIQTHRDGLQAFDFNNAH